MDQLKPALAGLLGAWTAQREEDETFQVFTARHTPEQLKAMVG